MEASTSFQTTDEVLTDRVCRGDQAAFDELYRRYSGPLAAYAGRMLRDRAAGEDVAQTALLNAYRALVAGNAPHAVRPWLYRIAYNATLVSLRRGNDVPMEEIEREQPDELEARDARASLVAGLNTLPERQRRVYLLRELRGLTVSEIAVELELKTEQVEQALFVAKNRLAEWLSFGAPVTCGLVRSTSRLRLGRGERRAVKAHLRSCPGCREVLAGEGSPTWLGAGLSGLFARVGSLLSTAGAPVAVKAGALAATAALGAVVGDPGLAKRFELLGATAAARPMPVAAAPAQRLLLAATDAVPLFVAKSAPPGGYSPAGAAPLAASADTAAPLGPLPARTRAPAALPTQTAAGTTTDEQTDPTATDGSGDGAATTDETDTETSADSGDSAASSDPSTDPSTDSSADPAATDPAATDPAATDPTATDAAATDPAADPSLTDPSLTDPSLTDPTLTDTTTTP